MTTLSNEVRKEIIGLVRNERFVYGDEEWRIRCELAEGVEEIFAAALAKSSPVGEQYSDARATFVDELEIAIGEACESAEMGEGFGAEKDHCLNLVEKYLDSLPVAQDRPAQPSERCGCHYMLMCVNDQGGNVDAKLCKRNAAQGAAVQPEQAERDWNLEAVQLQLAAKHAIVNTDSVPSTFIFTGQQLNKFTYELVAALQGATVQPSEDRESSAGKVGIPAA
jgi:hypothetical protein